ncbi:MAG TPA: hypothetical protein VFT62_09000 [Mycobacteriales bacterium]|nr:hypothetical protein [Mycobacteriales bacterium]
MRVDARVARGPLALLAAGITLSALLLLTNHDDPSYSCRGSAIADVVNPEPEGSAAFRRNFFDSGRQCNRDARVHVAAAGTVLVMCTIGSHFWWRRRRNRRSN